MLDVLPPQVEVVVVTPFQQNCSILWDQESRRAVVVDPGGDVPDILRRLGELELTVEAILLTHGHLDHAGGVETLREALGEAPGRAPGRAPGEGSGDRT